MPLRRQPSQLREALDAAYGTGGPDGDGDPIMVISPDLGRWRELAARARPTARQAVRWALGAGHRRAGRGHRIPDLRPTLLHEMVHTAVREDGHGARFRAELQRLAEAGDSDAEFVVWRMVGDEMWDDGWTGEESGRWERYREERQT